MNNTNENRSANARSGVQPAKGQNVSGGEIVLTGEVKGEKLPSPFKHHPHIDVKSLRWMDSLPSDFPVGPVEITIRPLTDDASGGEIGKAN